MRICGYLGRLFCVGTLFFIGSAPNQTAFAYSEETGVRFRVSDAVFVGPIALTCKPREGSAGRSLYPRLDGETPSSTLRLYGFIESKYKVPMQIRIDGGSIEPLTNLDEDATPSSQRAGVYGVEKGEFVFLPAESAVPVEIELNVSRTNSDGFSYEDVEFLVPATSNRVKIHSDYFLKLNFERFDGLNKNDAYYILKNLNFWISAKESDNFIVDGKEIKKLNDIYCK